MKRLKPNKRLEQKDKLYAEIIIVLRPTIKKYGKENVRLAMQRWNRVERERRSLLKKKEEIEKQLAEF